MSKISLAKGKKLQLRKSNGNVLAKAEIRLYWTSPEGVDYDLDASALQVRESVDPKFPFGRSLNLETVCFYGQPETTGIISSGDDQEGGDDAGAPNEVLTVDFARLRDDCAMVPVILSIDSARKRKQTFGEVRNARVELVDLDNDDVLVSSDLGDLPAGSIGALFVVLKREEGGWTFENVAKGYDKDLSEFLALFGVDSEY